MKILVTGGTGYIGSHTVVELQQKGYDVVVVDNLSNSRIEVLDNIEEITGIRPEFYQLDLSEQEPTFQLFKEHSDIAGIIHFAAYKAVGESVEKPLLYYRNNLQSLINILEGMLDNRIANLVFSSSCTVYGQPDELPVRETSPIKEAISPYGNTKQISEEIIRDTIHAFPQLKAISLRYFNPIGAHPSALIGELPLGIPSNLVPFITQTAIGKREVLRVYGKDYNTPDGTAIRDYIHVVDLSEAHVVALDRMLQNKMKNNYEIFNLGTGQGHTVLEVIRSFEKVSGVRLNYVFTDRRPGDVEKVWADTSYANQELGWKAKRSLDEMTLSAWRWELRLAGKLNE
ncbi:MAG TPA: UDP-glucose 4-epimerase GalE [Bacteroidales bacterium]|jgi:UDP-glucose 4-epimerase|nr:MAG: UDP-glucose 4-epimerase [Bacteroidetes bacterium ADurb.Bin012]HNQ60004.1 UDP-glucose 4-epimerase GalE [Bacteroidales bacterium]HNU21592.1 UDP-glucose 4-epimerase GalE [Bacteroidales bacterium]HNV17170.1 UDP-glucose 4-epimerase GalE [Bacteroidales bacterium]HNZ79161.1 UDP-glucose 4-epimerase GalE [Bacteroidales bacterium]